MTPAPRRLHRRRQMRLSIKAQLFALEYLKDMCATKAAVRAGYSPKTAQQQGSRLLSNVMVCEEIALGMVERKERIKIDTDLLEQQLERWR